MELNPGTSEPFPAWARALDVVAAAFFVLALSVATFGGFRERLVGGYRVSLTSAPLLLLYCVSAVGLRHLFWPRQPLYARLPAWLKRFARTDAFATAWPIFVTTRLAVFVIGYLAIVTFGYARNTPPYRMYETELQNLPVRWDAGWYLGIADTGYKWDDWALRHWTQQNVAFFPALPMAIRTAGRLIGERYLLAAQTLTLLSFLAALVYLYHLARDVLGHRDPAAVLALLAAYPFAVFFSAIYTEPLFLLCTVATFYHFHRGEYARAAVWGLLVGLSRPNGALLSIPLAMLALQQDQKPRPTTFRLAVAAMPGIGMLLFSAYVWTLAGRPFAWMEAHQAWGRSYHGLDWFFAQKYREIAEGFSDNPAALPIDVLNGMATVLALFLVWPIARRFGLAYGVFVLVNLIPPLFLGGLISMGRLTSVLFPTFLWLGESIPASWRPAWVAAFGMGQALGAALFFTWRPFI